MAFWGVAGFSLAVPSSFCGPPCRPLAKESSVTRLGFRTASGACENHSEAGSTADREQVASCHTYSGAFEVSRRRALTTSSVAPVFVGGPLWNRTVFDSTVKSSVENLRTTVRLVLIMESPLIRRQSRNHLSMRRPR